MLGRRGSRDRAARVRRVGVKEALTAARPSWKGDGARNGWAIVGVARQPCVRSDCSFTGMMVLYVHAYHLRVARVRGSVGMRGVRTLFAELAAGEDNLPGCHDAHASPVGSDNRKHHPRSGRNVRNSGNEDGERA